MSDSLKALIVDDDVNIALALKLIINSNFSCERVDTAVDGLEAWEKLQAEDYNLVISDWNMPRMDGNQLLKKMKEHDRTKKIAFLMVTVRKDVTSVASAVQAGVTDYIIKPFDKAVLLQKIEKLVFKTSRYQAAAEETVRSAGSEEVDRKSISVRVMEIIGKGEVSLPALPQVVFTIEDALKKEETDIGDLAKLIEVDPGISSKLIGVANSVFYRGVKECTLVEEAIARLGMKETKHFVYLISNRNLFALKDRRFEETIKDLYIHAVACGAACESLARHLSIPDTYNFFALGLLHDIGKLLVLQVLSEVTKNMRGIDMTMSTDIMNSLHTKAGYMLLSKWSFPQIYPLVALNHEDISAFDNPEKELLLVHFANIFIRELGFSLRTEKEQDILKIKSAQLLHVNAGIIKKVSVEVNENIEKISSIL